MPIYGAQIWRKTGGEGRDATVVRDRNIDTTLQDCRNFRVVDRRVNFILILLLYDTIRKPFEGKRNEKNRNVLPAADIFFLFFNYYLVCPCPAFPSSSTDSAPSHSLYIALLVLLLFSSRLFSLLSFFNLATFASHPLAELEW